MSSREHDDDKVRRTLIELSERATELQSRSILAGSRTHDLCNLLAAAIHSVEVLRLRPDQAPDPRTLDRLDEAMDGACDLAREMTSGSAVGEEVEAAVCLVEVARDVVARIVGLVGSSEGITVTAAEEAPPVHGSRYHLIHVVHSLVEAARRAGACQVWISVRRDEITPDRRARAWCSDRMAYSDGVVLEVRDDAPDLAHLPGDGPPWSEREQVLRSVARAHRGGVEVVRDGSESSVRLILPRDSESGGSEG